MAEAVDRVAPRLAGRFQAHAKLSAGWASKKVFGYQPGGGPGDSTQARVPIS